MSAFGWVRAASVACAVVALAWLARLGFGHEAISTELTWTRDVSLVFHHRCSGCHRDGGAGPMPLTTYAQVRPWAKAIKHQVLTRRMPPWGAVKGFGAFRNDRSLSLPEIALISSWVEGGAPQGDPTLAVPHDVHAADPAAAHEPEAGRLRVRGSLLLERALVATGISVSSSVKAPWLELTAHRPDGSVEHLLWLREPRPPVSMDYWFRREMHLPVGTHLICQPESVEVDLRIAVAETRW